MANCRNRKDGCAGGTAGSRGMKDAAGPTGTAQLPLDTPGAVGVNDASSSSANLPTTAADPDFVVCTLICYLGIPPAIWKSAIEMFVKAVSEQYKAEYALAEADKKFRAWKNKFIGYSVIKVLTIVITFSAKGRLTVIPVTRIVPAVTKLQLQLQKYLISKGAKLAGQKIVSQVLRKVVLVVELGFVGGCLAKCTAESAARCVIEFSKSISSGIVTAIKIIDGIADVVNGFGVAVFVRPIIAIRVMVDPNNWDLSELPAQVRQDMVVTFTIVWHSEIKNLKIGEFLNFITKPLTEYKIIPPILLKDITHGIANSIPYKPGAVGLFIPPEILAADAQRTKLLVEEKIEKMRLYELVQFLNRKKLLRLKVDIERSVDEQLKQQKK